MLGTYLPDEVVMTGVESVEIPLHGGAPDVDSFDSERLILVESQLTVEVSLSGRVDGGTAD